MSSEEMTKTTQSANGTLTNIFHQELELCDLTADEEVAIVYQLGARESYIQAFNAACEQLGANTRKVELPGINHPMFPYGGEFIKSMDSYFEENPSLIDPLTEVDMVIAISAVDFVHSEALDPVLDSGTRLLIVAEPPAVLERMLPRESLRERVENAKELIEQADTFRVISDSGTDITMDVGDSPPSYAQYGYTDEPGRWDNFPGGFAWFYPPPESPEGKIVVDTGDAILPPHKYADSPIEFTIEDGYVTDIQGESKDAKLLRDFYEMWDDEDAYATSHFGFGLDETAVWGGLEYYTDLIGQDARAFSGNFMWSTGPNRYIGRFTQAHVDFPMRDCTIYLDENPVVKSGKIVEPSLKPDGGPGS